MKEMTSQEKIRDAFESTPEKFHKYIKLIPSSGGPNPYMMVDGRVAMAWDDHAGNGETLSITTEIKEYGGESLICHATVVSSKRGTTQGTEPVYYPDRDKILAEKRKKQRNKEALLPEETSPFQVAETSAVGRALGFMGYGLFGGGIASADELERVVGQNETTPELLSRAQKDALHAISEKLGMDMTQTCNWVEEYVGHRDISKLTSSQATALIDAAKESLRTAGKSNGDTALEQAKTHPITKKQEEALDEIATKLNLDDAAVTEWLTETGKTSFDELTSVQAESLIASGQKSLRSAGKMEGPTREESRALFAAASAKGLKHEDIHAYMKKAFIGLDRKREPSTKLLSRIEYQQVMQAIENGTIRPPVGTSTVIAEVGENGEKVVNGEKVDTKTGEIKDEAKEKTKMPC